MVRNVLPVSIVAILVFASFQSAIVSVFAQPYHESGVFAGNSAAQAGSLDQLITQNSKLKSDFGAVNLGQDALRFNGIPQRSLIYGSGSLNTAAGSHVVGIAGGSPGSPFLGYAISPTLSSNVPLGTGFTFSPDAQLQFDSYSQVDPGRFSGSSIIRSDQANQTFGVTGKGVNVAIVDTGSDFSNPDVSNAVARDSNGVPIMLDPDGQGLVLTRAVYAAKIDETTGTIADFGFTSDSSLPKGTTSYVSVNSTGVYLKATHGNIPTYNPLYPYLGTPVLNATANVDWKIGKSGTDYIRSISGRYHFGLILEATSQTGSLMYTIVPVLVVDSKQYGVYDTIIPDIRSGFYFFAQNTLASQKSTASLVPSPVFDFTDQRRITIGDGNENLVYDFNHDGYPDFSAGTLGARVADIWQVINGTKKPVADNNGGGFVAARLLPPFDIKGGYLGVMYDMQGHGTSTAAIVSSSGTHNYSIYSGSGAKTVPLRGMAPGAKIIPVKALWAGDALYGWLWASGFDINESTGKWSYTGAHKADIISNSWGVSSFPILDRANGYDIMSIFASLLSLPKLFATNYPGTLFVVAAGNDGIAYGSIGVPNASPLAITVGATTSNVHLGYGPFANISRFGGSPQAQDGIADFSSRGPSVFGDPKPELMAVGEYGFTPWLVNDKTIHSTATDPANDKAFVLFGGTSMATPMVAGAAALAEEKMRSNGGPPDPFSVKSVLMSSAKDLGNDPFVQGAGRVDALAAMQIVDNSTGAFSAYAKDTVPNLLSQMVPELKEYNSTFSLIGGVQNLTESVLQRISDNQPESRWYAGTIADGGKASTSIVVDNPTNAPMQLSASAVTEQLIVRKQIHNATILSQKDPVRSNASTYGYVPNYHNVTKEFGPIPSDADLMVAKINIPFKEFMNSSDVFGNSLRIASIYAYDWTDSNHDRKVSYNETNMLGRGGSWGTVEEVRINDPVHAFKGTPVIGAYPVQTLFSFWSGDRHINSTSLNYTLTVEYYKRQADPAVQLDTSSITVPPKSAASIGATLSVDDNKMPGVYSSWIRISNALSHRTVLMPVSYVVASKPVPKDIPVVLSPAGTDQSSIGLRPNGYVGGLFDMLSRYAAGDWRSYYFTVSDSTINSMALKVAWPHNATSINVMAFGPDGKLIASSVPPGVFSTFASWASNDWLGTTSVSEGGGFYFSQNDGNNATLVHVPINQTGVYSVLLHNTLFEGSSIYEPVTVQAKFTTILPDTSSPIISASVPKIIAGTVGVPVSVSDDDPAGFSYSIDGNAPVTQPGTQGAVKIDGALLAEGRHQIVIQSTDTVGHSTQISAGFIVDRTPPSVSFHVKYPDGTDHIIGHDNMQVAKGSVLYWNVTDDNGIIVPFDITLPDSTHVRQNSTSSSMPITLHYSNVTHGGYVVNVTDTAGNRAVVSANVWLDDTAPKVSLSGPAGDVSGTIKLQLSASDDDLRSVLLDIGGIRTVNATGMHEYSLNTAQLPDGKYKVTLTATDSVGNVGSASADLSVVNAGPAIQMSLIYGLLIGGAVATGAWLAIVWKVRRGPAPQNLK